MPEKLEDIVKKAMTGAEMKPRESEPPINAVEVDLNAFNFTHRCKFDNSQESAALPICPLFYELCHSPCDLLGDVHIQATIKAPDGVYDGGFFNFADEYLSKLQK